MKCLLFLVAALAIVSFAEVSAESYRHADPPYVNRPSLPKGNPRFRRTPGEPTGSIEVSVGASQGKGKGWEGNIGVTGSISFRKPQEQRPHPDVVSLPASEVQSRVARSPAESRGKIEVSGGASKGRGGRWEGNIGVTGSISFRKPLEQQAQPDVNAQPEPEVQSRVERSPEESRGKVVVSGGASKGKGGKWEGNIGVSGSISFRKPQEQRPHPDVVSLPASEVQSRVARSPGKSRGKIEVSGGGSKGRGGRWEGNIGVRGSISFRKPLEKQAQPDVSAQPAPEVQSRVARSPAESRGKIEVSGGASKGRGGKWGGTIGVTGSISFRKPQEQQAQPDVNAQPASETQSRAARSAPAFVQGTGKSPKVKNSITGKWVGNLDISSSIPLRKPSVEYPYSDVVIEEAVQPAIKQEEPVRGDQPPQYTYS